MEFTYLFETLNQEVFEWFTIYPWRSSLPLLKSVFSLGFDDIIISNSFGAQFSVVLDRVNDTLGKALCHQSELSYVVLP